MPLSTRRALACAFALAGAVSSCFKVDVIPKAYNSGALGGYPGDPQHDPADRRRRLVTAVVKAELVDGYFGQGDSLPADSIDAWLARGAQDTAAFCWQVVDWATNKRANTVWTCPGAPERAIAPKAARDLFKTRSMSDTLEHLSDVVERWSPRQHRPVCPSPGVRDDAAIAAFSDHVRFHHAIERAVQGLVPALVEGLIDTNAIVDGAREAMQEARAYLRQRTWKRRLDSHVTGLVVQGGAVDGIYSAGAVWVVLHLINGCDEDEICSSHGTLDFRLRLLSGTSTGAMVSTATDVFNSCADAVCRNRVLDQIVQWFTCLGLNDLYCVRNNSVADLLSTQAGALEFDGIGEQLRSVVSCQTMTTGSELILNTVDFRSGRLFDLSDQDPAELQTPEDVVQGAIASAVLPAIARPVQRLPVNYDPAVPAVYLDGGIRSELPILPLVRRGAERVLVVSSSASTVSETAYLKDALSIAKRYIDISTGGVSESEILHAERQVESVRLGENDNCTDHASDVCSGHCAPAMLCEGRWDEVCVPSERREEGATKAPKAKVPRAPEESRIGELWQTLSIHRDEEKVASVPGYQFDPKLARQLFEAGAESARARCLEIARLLGMNITTSEASIVKWCAPEALKADACRAVKHKASDPTKLRSCVGPYVVAPSCPCERRRP
jgi:predicted acylesterase/phospholipase RssA